jgi:hypothetical protein
MTAINACNKQRYYNQGYRVNLWWPSMWTTDSGALTEYRRRKIERRGGMFLTSLIRLIDCLNRAREIRPWVFLKKPVIALQPNVK